MESIGVIYGLRTTRGQEFGWRPNGGPWLIGGGPRVESAALLTELTMATSPLTLTELKELTSGLHRLARNLWWSWDQDAQDVFHDLSPRAWQNLYHNAVAILHEVSDYELRMRLHDPAFAARVRKVLGKFDAYLKQPDTWAAGEASGLKDRPVAYFSAEFAFHETLPIAAGGLGALAGDHAKSASDLGLPFVGISLFYREGYFQQAFNQDNWQTEYYTQLNPKNLPLEPVLNAAGEKLVCSVRMASSTVFFQAWRVNIGRVPVYLLDTNRPENEPHFRDLTLRVYGGDSTTRILQEIVLGIGGVRLLRALGHTPSTFHMNEGHAAFLTLELIREKLAAGQSFAAAAATTTREQLMDLGRVEAGNASEPFCMTVLALRYSRAANGVSELHGEVSREMWQEFFGAKTSAEVPIGHVTNGVHLVGWMKATVRRFWQAKYHQLNPGRTDLNWVADANTVEFWRKASDPACVSDSELWALRYRLRRELVEFARRRLLLQGHTMNREDFIAFDGFLNPDALTIGFARRFATYKRAPLIFDQFESVVKLVRDSARPIQFIFAGKAHPKDDSGKAFIQKVIHLSKFSELKGHLVFIENYDIHVARMMVSGCDIWLNNPRRPLEASGTSGMKTTPHGCLNLSILDGWWREGYDGTNGFAIGPDSHPASIEEQDRVDSVNLYTALTEQVIPQFYSRDADGIPRQWIARIRRSLATLAAEYSTWRMVQEYTKKYYLPPVQ